MWRSSYTNTGEKYLVIRKGGYLALETHEQKDERLEVKEGAGPILSRRALIVPFLKRLVASFDEALNASAIEAEKRIEAEALPVISGELWMLRNEGVCQALWFRRLKAQKV